MLIYGGLGFWYWGLRLGFWGWGYQLIGCGAFWVFLIWSSLYKHKRINLEKNGAGIRPGGIGKWNFVEWLVFDIQVNMSYWNQVNICLWVETWLLWMPVSAWTGKLSEIYRDETVQKWVIPVPAKPQWSVGNTFLILIFNYPIDIVIVAIHLFSSVILQILYSISSCLWWTVGDAPTASPSI